MAATTITTWTDFVEHRDDDEPWLLQTLRAQIAEPGFVWEHAGFNRAVQHTLDHRCCSISSQQQLRLLETCLLVRRELYEPWRLRFVESPLPRCATYTECALWMRAMIAANADPRTLQRLVEHFDAGIPQAKRAEWNDTVVGAVRRVAHRHDTLLLMSPHERLHEFREGYLRVLAGSGDWPEQDRAVVEDLAVPWVHWAPVEEGLLHRLEAMDAELQAAIDGLHDDNEQLACKLRAGQLLLLDLALRVQAAEERPRLLAHMMMVAQIKI